MMSFTVSNCAPMFQQIQPDSESRLKSFLLRSSVQQHLGPWLNLLPWHPPLLEKLVPSERCQGLRGSWSSPCRSKSWSKMLQLMLFSWCVVEHEPSELSILLRSIWLEVAREFLLIVCCRILVRIWSVFVSVYQFLLFYGSFSFEIHLTSTS